MVCMHKPYRLTIGRKFRDKKGLRSKMREWKRKLNLGSPKSKPYMNNRY